MGKETLGFGFWVYVDLIFWEMVFIYRYMAILILGNFAILKS